MMGKIDSQCHLLKDTGWINFALVTYKKGKEKDGEKVDTQDKLAKRPIVNHLATLIRHLAIIV